MLRRMGELNLQYVVREREREPLNSRFFYESVAENHLVGCYYKIFLVVVACNMEIPF